MAYSKLHSSLVNSSLWTEPDHVRLLFITLLALCDKDGYVYGSRPGLERAAMIDLEACKELNPWDVLMGPDEHSSDKMRAPENEGRRIEEVPGGFRLLNFAYYRGLRNDDDRREQNRIAQERFRQRNKQSKPASATVSPGNPPKAHTEAEADTEAGGGNPPSNGEMILWEGRSWYPSRLIELKKDVQQQIHSAEGEELKFLKAKLKSLKIALGVKSPKVSVRSAPKLEIVRPPPTPEEGKKLADALRQAVSEAT